VVRFVDELVAHRPKRNLLLRVCREASEGVRASRGGEIEVVTPSDEEVSEMNAFLGQDALRGDYGLGPPRKCAACGRELTFYDAFLAGRRLHGDEFIKVILDGKHHYVQVAKRDAILELACTSCGHTNQLRLDDGHGYHARGYYYC
jgi:hypothetical protein